jgi:hypothetical protein
MIQDDPVTTPAEVPAPTSPFDMNRLRPLEVRVRTRAELPGGGTSEHQANRFGRVSADAIVLLRALMDEGALHLSVATLDGETLGPVSPSALFHLWVSFTGHVARMPLPADDEQAARQVAFCQKVLLLMQLDTNMDALARVTAGAEGEALAETTSAASERPASTPASPSLPPDDAPSSGG